MSMLWGSLGGQRRATAIGRTLHIRLGHVSLRFTRVSHDGLPALTALTRLENGGLWQTQLSGTGRDWPTSRA